MEIRNIAIIAHVDHGKTTIVDRLMQQCGAAKEGVSMDSNQLEQERGITIYAKNTSVQYKGTKINIVDTPGHADFGSEVERVLRAIDTVVLLVDAQEGPMPQTRFVLKKSLQLGFVPIVVLNKIDKPAADPKRVHDEILELFIELGATDAQINFPTLYAIGREGIAKKELADDSKNLDPLLETILEHVPSVSGRDEAPFKGQVFNLGYDTFLGRLAITRVYEGTLSVGQTIFGITPDGSSHQGKVTKLFSFEGLNRVETQTVISGDIVVIAGIPDIDIGETIVTDTTVQALPRIPIDEPTISLKFLVNDSPFAGREGTFVTSRQIRERLERELKVNVGLRVDFSSNEYFTVYGRGELHIAVLLEQMRREGYELQVSVPTVVYKEENGQKLEPIEELAIDVPTEFAGAVMSSLGRRRGIPVTMSESDGITRMILDIPTRGLLGYRNQFVVETKGEGILSSRFSKYAPYVGDIEHKDVGSMTSMVSGKAVAFSLANLQERGTLYIDHGTEVYEGMVIGNTSKGDELSVNPIKGKQLTNMRASGTDEAIVVRPPYTLSIERGLEIMNEDEYLEITPLSVRLRKQALTELDRTRSKRKGSE